MGLGLPRSLLPQLPSLQQEKPERAGSHPPRCPPKPCGTRGGSALEIEAYFSVFSEASQAVRIWFRFQSYLGEGGGRGVGGVKSGVCGCAVGVRVAVE